jgi:multiple sugar transport system permease protein
MTGGGPGGATRLYSILAYEKALIGLRFGPGAAVAFSMAPFLAIFIALLARFMLREQSSVAASSEDSFMDRVLDALGRGLGAVLDVVLWPVKMIANGAGALFGALGRAWTGGRQMSLRNREHTGNALRFVLILPFLLFVLFPFYWVIITAFKTETQITTRTSIFWPDPWTLDQITSLLTETGYPLWFRNTVIVATLTTVLSVAIAALAGYALARLEFRGRSWLTTALLVTYLLPGSLMFIPLYRILSTLGIIDSLAALIATYPTFLMPFATWVMLGYYRSIPADLEQAAQIDGATRLGAFWRITLPLALPALLSVMLFSFTNAWNEFLFAFVFITREQLFTLPVGLQQLVFGDIYPWGQLMSASLLMAIPVVIIYTLAQRYMVEGLTAGSVKG